MLALSDALATAVSVFGPGFAFFSLGALALMHIAISLAVGADARARVANGAHLCFGLSGFWSGLALFTGLVGLTLYWVFHYSRLSLAVPTDGTAGPAHDPRRS